MGEAMQCSVRDMRFAAYGAWPAKTAKGFHGLADEWLAWFRFPMPLTYADAAWHVPQAVLSGQAPIEAYALLEYYPDTLPAIQNEVIDVRLVKIGSPMPSLRSKDWGLRCNANRICAEGALGEMRKWAEATRGEEIYLGPVYLELLVPLSLPHGADVEDFCIDAG